MLRCDAVEPPEPPLRSTRRGLFRFFGACCLGGAGYATLIEPRWLEVTEHEVPVPGLPGHLAGFTIAQLSDLHLSRLGSLHERVLEVLREKAPQLVLLTGDAVEDRSALPVLAELTSALRQRAPEVIAIRGNWEHWGEIPLAELAATYAKSGAQLLGNESLALGDGVVLIGTDDGCTGNANLHRALRDLPAGEVRLLATHAPGILDAIPAAAPSIALALAGHTHGGQVRAAGESVWVPPGSGRFVSGMYTTTHGQAYVSRGIGTSVLPVRFTCRPELPIFRLTRG